MNFQQFVNIFPIKFFHLVSYLYEMNTLAFINFLLVKLFPTLIRLKFAPYSTSMTYGSLAYFHNYDWLTWPPSYNNDGAKKVAK